MLFFVENFVTKTQIPAVQDTHFDEFMIPSLKELMDWDREEM